MCTDKDIDRHIQRDPITMTCALPFGMGERANVTIVHMNPVNIEIYRRVFFCFFLKLVVPLNDYDRI